MRPKIIKKGVKPLCYINESTILAFSKWKLYKYDLNKNILSYIIDVPVQIKRRICSYFRIFSRKYGLETIQAVKINDRYYFVIEHGKPYLLDIIDETFKLINDQKYNILRLYSYGESVYWGEYGYNPTRRAMSIFEYDLNGYIKKVFTFSPGTINHVHNIIFDEKDKEFYVFTGDFDHSAAIYKFNKNFTEYQIIKNGEQRFRGVECCYSDNNLFWITDSPMEKNYVMKYNASEGVTRVSDVVNGSCIYGEFDGKDLYFSTVVENETIPDNNYKNKYRYNKGSGILSWDSCVYKFNLKDSNLEKIFSAKKDILPMIPFKYGTFIFANNSHKINSDFIVLFGQSVKKYDGKMVILNKKDFDL